MNPRVIKPDPSEAEARCSKRHSLDFAQIMSAYIDGYAEAVLGAGRASYSRIVSLAAITAIYPQGSVSEDSRSFSSIGYRLG